MTSPGKRSGTRRASHTTGAASCPPDSQPENASLCSVCAGNIRAVQAFSSRRQDQPHAVKQRRASSCRELDAQEPSSIASLRTLAADDHIIPAHTPSIPAGRAAYTTLRTMAFVSRHYHEANLTLRSAAGAIGISESHCCRLLRRYLGIGFREYLRQIRLLRAQWLLTSTSQSIKAIALDVGYHRTAEFDRHFKAHTGLPPTAWRLLNSANGGRAPTAGGSSTRSAWSP